MNEFLEQFLLEARELADQATQDLLALEQRPNEKDRLDRAFRAFHTLKGGAGIVDFDAMARMLHAAEDILAAWRSGARSITPPAVGDCLACLDQVIGWLDAIETSGELPADADAAADAMILRLGGTSDGMQTFRAEPSMMASPDSPGAFSGAAREILEAQLSLLADTTGHGDGVGRVASAGRVAANVLRRLEQNEAAESVAAAAGLAQAHRDPAILSAAITRCLADPPSTLALKPETFRQEAAVRTLRIDSERVDALVDLTGELTVAKNALGHLAKLAVERQTDLASPLRAQHASLERLIGGLQHAVLAMRVLPLRQVFQRFPRLVRELAESLGKPCRLVTEGDDTEADKAIVEALYEPLLHIVRNAVDHGVEAPTRRQAAGKPELAIVSLRGFRQGDHVLIEVQDDGAGIDVARVRREAVARGIVTDETVEALSDAAAMNLIFEPGFSTASGVTGLSGRGVGMDAVRAAVERLGGRVSVASQLNVGSTVRFDLPFSIMLTQVMTVEAGGQRFGIPLEAIVESVEIDRDRINPIGAARAFVHRDRTIPIVDLNQALGQEARARPPRALLIVVSMAGQLGALEVDRIGERLDVILKPVAGLLSGIRWISGTTLMGDGNVLLVLDVVELLS